MTLSVNSLIVSAPYHNYHHSETISSAPRCYIPRQDINKWMQILNLLVTCQIRAAVTGVSHTSNIKYNKRTVISRMSHTAGGIQEKSVPKSCVKHQSVLQLIFSFNHRAGFESVCCMQVKQPHLGLIITGAQHKDIWYQRRRSIYSHNNRGGNQRSQEVWDGGCHGYRGSQGPSTKGVGHAVCGLYSDARKRGSSMTQNTYRAVYMV